LRLQNMFTINIECIYIQKRIPPIIQIFVIIYGYTMISLRGIFCIISTFIKTLNNAKLCPNHTYHLFVKNQFDCL